MPDDRKTPKFNRNPMFWLGVCYALGILLSGLVPLDGTYLPVISTFVFAGLAIGLSKYRLSTVFIALAFVSAGAVSFRCEVERNKMPGRVSVLYDNGTIRSGEPVEVEGVLIAGREPSVDGDFLTLRAEKVTYWGETNSVTGNVRLFVPGSESGSQISDLKYGSRIRVSCKLERDDDFLNPGVMPRKQMLDRLGIDASGSVKSRLLIEKLADESVFLPLAWVFDQRAKLIESFRSNLSPRAAGVMIASLLGDKYFLDKETADLFRDGGTFHILVISGLHITFIGGLLLLIVRLFTRNRSVQFAVTNGVLWAYTLAVGADVPVVRAAVMFTVISFSHVIYRQSSLLNSLGVCGVILLVWRPTELFDPSLQLTFVSVGAIVACAYPLVETLRKIGTWTPSATEPFPPNVPNWLLRFCETLYWNPNAWRIESKRNIWSAGLWKSPYFSEKVLGGGQRLIRYLFEGILVSLIVQVWMLPLTVVYFHRVSLASVLLNLWVGVFIAIESFAAVIGAMIGYFGEAFGRPLFAIAEMSDWLMLSLPRLFSDNGLASSRLPAYSGPGKIVYFLFFIPVFFFAVAQARWKPFELKVRAGVVSRRVLIPSFAALVALSLIIVFHPFSAPKADGRLHIDFLDVGQGDAALVTFPDGRTLLVDGGGRINYKNNEDGEVPFVRDVRGIGEAVVSEYLWYRGYSRVDHILATHADADHIQGLTDVAKNFSVGSAVFGRTPADDPDFAELAALLKRRGIASTKVFRGDTLQFGDVMVEVLYPEFSDDPNAASDNDNSVVLRIIYGNRKFLLTGDIERRAESALASGDLSADLIKVPHHGSRTSSTQAFVDSVGAKYAVISVGRTSPFGHPHGDVVDRWRASGADVMTSGERGEINISTDGTDLVLNRFAPK